MNVCTNRPSRLTYLLSPIMELQPSLVRVPVESMRINLKTMQSTIEKRLTVLADAQASQSIDNETLLAELVKIKAQAAELANRQTELADQAIARQEFLKELELCAINRASDLQGYMAAIDRSLDVAIVDHCTSQGYVETAARYAKSKNIEQLADLDLLAELGAIIKEMNQHIPTRALQWCATNRAFLRKRASTVESRLRTYEVLRMIKIGDVYEAIAYSRKHMTKFASPYGEEMALIGSTLGGVQEQYYDLSSLWVTLSLDFVTEFMVFHGRSSHFNLLSKISAGLAALRTRKCGPHDLSELTLAQAAKTEACPVCSPEFRDLATHVPFANHTHSILPADPVKLLGTNRIYSQKDLTEYSKQQDSWPSLTDPYTKRTHDELATIPVYPC